MLPTPLGFVASTNAAVTYFIGDAERAAGYSLPRDEQRHLTGLDAALDGAAPFDAGHGEVLLVAKNMGAGLASIHRAGEIVLVCEPDVGYAEERGEEPADPDIEETMRAALRSWSLVHAQRLGEFDVECGAFAIVYSWADGSRVREALDAVEDGEAEWESVMAADGGDFLGAVVARPRGRYALFASAVPLGGEEGVILAILPAEAATSRPT